MSGIALSAIRTLPAAEAPVSRKAKPFGAFRFLLALMVVLQHFHHLLSPAGARMFSHLGLGAIAVSIFFVVSGFVVAEANLVFYRGRPLAFLLNRLVRVIPPYLAALALSVAVHAALWRAGRLALWDYTLAGSPLAPGLLAGGLLGPVPGFDPSMLGPAFEFIPFVWSLRVEMAFYLAATAALMAAERWRRAVPACLSLGAAASALFLLRMRPGLLSDAPMFLLGVAICSVPGRGGRSWPIPVCCLLSAAGFLSLRQHGDPLAAFQLAAFAALTVLFVALSKQTVPGRWAGMDRALGALSYPLYLNHYAIGILAYDLSPRRDAVVYGTAICVSMGVAWAMARMVETPLVALRARIRGVTL